MRNALPPWAVYSIVVPLVLLSPVIAFLLAIVAETVIGCLIDAGTRAWIVLGAGIGGLILSRRLCVKVRRARAAAT
jgi:hypothetical protein